MHSVIRPHPVPFLETGPSLSQNSSVTLSWLASKLQESPCFCLLVLGSQACTVTTGFLPWALNSGPQFHGKHLLTTPLLGRRSFNSVSCTLESCPLELCVCHMPLSLFILISQRDRDVAEFSIAWQPVCHDLAPQRSSSSFKVVHCRDMYGGGSHCWGPDFNWRPGFVVLSGVSFMLVSSL